MCKYYSLYYLHLTIMMQKKKYNNNICGQRNFLMELYFPKLFLFNREINTIYINTLYHTRLN